MKKINFIILLLILISISCKKKNDPDPEPGPTGNSCWYDFSKTITSYVPISSPDGYYNESDNSGYKGWIPIPFPFKVLGKSVTEFSPGGNNTWFYYDSSEQVYMTLSLSSAYTIWKTQGTAGDRIIKMQFQDTEGSTDKLNFQLWLYENGNKIEVHFGKMFSGSGSSSSGVGGAPFLIRRETASTLEGIALSGTTIDPVEEIYIGNPDSAVIHCLNDNSCLDCYILRGNIPEGLTYTFTPKN